MTYPSAAANDRFSTLWNFFLHFRRPSSLFKNYLFFFAGKCDMSWWCSTMNERQWWWWIKVVEEFFLMMLTCTLASGGNLWLIHPPGSNWEREDCCFHFHGMVVVYTLTFISIICDSNLPPGGAASMSLAQILTSHIFHDIQPWSQWNFPPHHRVH